MNTFDMNLQAEEMNMFVADIFGLIYQEWCEECEKNFFKASISLLEYKLDASYDLYVGAVIDAYENASDDMMEYMRMININNVNELLIYLSGFERGLKG